MRQLERSLGIRFGTLRYHLRLLRKGGLVVTRKIDRFRLYFVAGELGRRDKHYLYHLRQELPRRIALEVAYSRWLSRAALVDRLFRTPSTISFHLRKLVQNGTVHETTMGRRKFYRVANPSRLHRLLARYEHTFIAAVDGVSPTVAGGQQTVPAAREVAANPL